MLHWRSLMNCRAGKIVLAAGLALLGVAHAGHEFPFYPSFYPQEITVEALDARSAAERIAKGKIGRASCRERVYVLV